MPDFTTIKQSSTVKAQEERITVSVATRMIEKETTLSFGDFALECGLRIPDIYTMDILHRERTVKLSSVRNWIDAQTADGDYERTRS